MISVPVRDTSGNEVGTYEFDPAELSPRINKQLLHDVVVMYQANRRVGAAKTRKRGEVSGSSRKLYRQKGTGRARAGQLRTPVRRGGGHTFARRPKDWSYRLPKKAVKQATQMALLSKFLDEQVTILDDLAVEEPKTRVVAGVLRSLGLGDTTCLLAIEAYDPNVWKSARNIPNLDVSPAAELNAYDVLRRKQLVITKSAMDRLRGQSNEAAAAQAD